MEPGRDRRCDRRRGDARPAPPPQAELIIAVVAVALLAIAALFLMGGSGEKAAAPKADAGEQLPAVSVIVPGRQDIPALISATGSLAARRDMPVGSRPARAARSSACWSSPASGSPPARRSP